MKISDCEVEDVNLLELISRGFKIYEAPEGVDHLYKSVDYQAKPGQYFNRQHLELALSIGSLQEIPVASLTTK